MDIRERIEQLIKESSRPRKDIVRAVAKSSSNFNKMIVSPSYPTIVKLANALDVPIWKLFKYEEESDEVVHSVFIDGVEYVPKQ